MFDLATLAKIATTPDVGHALYELMRRRSRALVLNAMCEIAADPLRPADEREGARAYLIALAGTSAKVTPAARSEALAPAPLQKTGGGGGAPPDAPAHGIIRPPKISRGAATGPADRPGLCRSARRGNRSKTLEKPMASP